MINRRWFVTPELLEWKLLVARGEYHGPLFTFPAQVFYTPRGRIFQDPNLTRAVEMLYNWEQGIRGGPMFSGFIKL